MRTEFTVIITEKNGKKQYCTYAGKKHADECFDRCKPFYEKRGGIVEYYKNQFVGNSFYKSEKLG